MAIDVIGNTGATGTQQTLGMQDFLKILLTQLTYQDPLKPMDNQEFMAQMAQFSSLEQARQLGDKVDRLLGLQAATQSVGLIGRTVEINTADGTVAGQVTALNLAGQEPQLSLKLSSGQILTGIGLGQIVNVR
jgi:flagellar basal-body rod modification protein FlgD